MFFHAIHAENSASILKLVDNVKETILSLQILDHKKEWFSDTIFPYILIQKLDSTCKIWWEHKCKRDKLPKIKNLIWFLKSQARTLQVSKPDFTSITQKKYQNKEKA